MQNKGRMSTVR